MDPMGNEDRTRHLGESGTLRPHACAPASGSAIFTGFQQKTTPWRWAKHQEMIWRKLVRSTDTGKSVDEIHSPGATRPATENLAHYPYIYATGEQALHQARTQTPATARVHQQESPVDRPHGLPTGLDG